MLFYTFSWISRLSNLHLFAAAWKLLLIYFLKMLYNASSLIPAKSVLYGALLAHFSWYNLKNPVNFLYTKFVMFDLLHPKKSAKAF